LGQAAATAPNAQATKMTAVFWIETVQEQIDIAVHKKGHKFTVKGALITPGQQVPTFTGTIPIDMTAPRKLTVTYTQIQYTQTVILSFNGLFWPHVSVNTLVPADPVEVPESAWT
jgi:hypothetical protein